jgi:signal transduction histidine kinase
VRPLPARAVTIGLVGGAFVVAASSAVVALGSRGAKVTSYAGASPGHAVLATLTTVALLAAAVALERSRRTATALATLALGCAWSADVWAGWPGAPTPLRSIGMLFVPMVAPLMLLVIATVFGRGRAMHLAVATSTVGVAAACALWLVRDPYLDRYCWRDCLARSLAPFPDPGLARAATDLTLVLGATCGSLAAVLCGLRLVRGTDRSLLFLAGVVSGVTLAARGVVLRVAPAEDPRAALYSSLFAAAALGLLGLAAALGYLGLRPWLVRRQIAALAAEPDLAAGGLAASFAAALDDSQVQIGYPLADGAVVVDAEGRPLTLPGQPARIVRGGEVIALVGSPVGPPSVAALERALCAAARLALANERLRAEESFRLRELTQLRRRIVAAGDATRRRLERDLHDGAQQRLLALAIDLRVALKRARAVGRTDVERLLGAAVDLVGVATEELRVVAHGIFPATLASSGLAAALDTLADAHPVELSVELAPGRRFPAEVEAAAYAVVAEATADGRALARVAVEERGSQLLLTVVAPGMNGLAAEERVRAAGGTFVRAGRRLEAALPAPPPTRDEPATRSASRRLPTRS